MIILENEQKTDNPLITAFDGHIRSIMRDFIAEERSKWEAEKAAENAAKDPKLIPRLEAIKELKINSSTSWRWERAGYLVPVRIGCKVYYKASDIENLINGGK